VDSGPGSASEVRARVYDADCKPRGAVFRVDDVAPNSSGAMPAVAQLANGRVVAVWQSRDQITQKTRIMAQRLNLKGAVPAPD
jgi:hypothetical protein